MRSKRLYLLTSIMAFLSAPLVFRSWGGSIVWLPVPGLITPVLEIFVLVVISVKIRVHHRQIALLLRVIAVLIALRALPHLLMHTSGDALSTPFFLGYIFLGSIILISLVTMYALLLSYLQTCNDPALKLLKIHCALRICGWALTLPIAASLEYGLDLFMSMNLVALFHLAAQIALGIMVLRYARQGHTTEVGHQDENLDLPLANHG